MEEPDVYQQNLKRITQIEEAVDKMIAKMRSDSLLMKMLL